MTSPDSSTVGDQKGFHQRSFAGKVPLVHKPPLRVSFPTPPLFLLLVFSLACAHAPAPPPTNSSHRLEPYGEGWASFYGAELSGNRTASGERFNPKAFTAAHRT